MRIRIKELCDGKEIKTAYELAKLAKLGMPTAYRAFADDIKHFTPETLEKLCVALGCSPNDIFGYDSVTKMIIETPEAKTDEMAAESVIDKSATNSIADRVITEPIAAIPITKSATDDVLSLDMVASRLNKSRATIQKYVKDGKLRAKKIPSRHILRLKLEGKLPVTNRNKRELYFQESELQAFLEDKTK